MEKGEMGENATGRLTTYYVAECMEFNRYGEYREDIHSAEEAVKIYQSIPSERLNAGKGIGLHVEEEDGIPLEFSLVYNGELDVDLLRDIYDQNQYPEVFIAARELSAYLPETKVIDTKGLLTEKTLEATVFADEMIKLEKNLDPDFYHTFYPKEAEHKEAIIWKALCQDGKEEYSRWLGSKIFEQKSELKEQADKLKTTLEQVKLIPPVDLKPFVYVRISEHPDIPLEEAMPLNQAVELLGKGTHYVSDLNEPHHASNLTAVNSNHSDFEKYVDKHRTEYTIAGNSFGTNVYSSAENTAVGDMLYSAAKDAKALAGLAQNKDTYSSAGNQSVQNAIKTVSKYIYKFGKEVGIY